MLEEAGQRSKDGYEGCVENLVLGVEDIKASKLYRDIKDTVAVREVLGLIIS